MKLPQSHKGVRGGFTLIELLVVIAIIAVLIGLLMAAVMALLNKGPATQDRVDVGTLDQAVKNFYAKNKCYPPSKIFLSNKRASYGTSALHLSSLQYLGRIFPSLDWNQPIDWSGGMNTALLNTGITLQGDQCLVFFLGGIPTLSNGTPGCLGFSSNAANPTLLPTAGEQRIKFYEFKSNRLVKGHGSNASSTNPFYSYLNPFDPPLAKPYAYFSSYEVQNGYNSRFPTGLGKSDCQALKVNPYAETWANPAPRFLNPSGFQIISAGADGQFGIGTSDATTTWSAANPGSVATGAGKDDISNFSSGVLSAAQ